MIKIVSNTGNNQTHCFKAQGLLKKNSKKNKNNFLLCFQEEDDCTCTLIFVHSNLSSCLESMTSS